METSFLDYLASHNIISDEQRQKLARWLADARIPIGMLAVHHGMIVGSDIDRVLDRQRDTNVLFGELAIEMGLLNKAQISTLLGIQRFQLLVSAAEALALSGETSFQKAVDLLAGFVKNHPDWAQSTVPETTHC